MISKNRRLWATNIIRNTSTKLVPGAVVPDHDSGTVRQSWVARLIGRLLDLDRSRPYHDVWQIVAALALSWVVGIAAGGAGKVAPLWFFVPILLAAARFGNLGAVLSGALAAVVAGPLLPASVAHASHQVTSDWISRGISFIAIGLVFSLVLDQLHRTMARERILIEQQRAASEQAEKAFRLSVEQLQEQTKLLDLAHDGILVRSAETDVIRYWNQGAEHLYGWTKAEAVGAISQDLLHTKFPRPLREIREELRLRGHWEGELQHLKRDGSPIVVASHWAQNTDDLGQRGVILEIDSDITEQKNFQSQLQHQALHDALTGLPNRVLFHDRLEQAILSAHRDSSSMALLLLDLDRFKEVNDALGHQTGDRLLQELALRLSAVLRGSDTVARLGGDEFAVILARNDREQASRMASKLQLALRQPLVLDRHRIDLDASMGIALFPLHGEDAETLLRRADVAMYAAKRSGAGQCMYASELDVTSQERLSLVADLRQALVNNEFLLHYQPKVNLRTGRVDHVEALVRWQHPEHGLISPGEFIPLAEETGVIESLTLWILRTALEQCVLWHGEHVELSVAVNVSTRSLRDQGVAQTIADIVARSGAQPSALILEITESTLMRDPAQALHVLTELHDMGIKLSVDDFGTGYSSLAYLKELPIDEIKIDRSFVREMARDGSEIVRSVIDLGHNLGLTVTAEGVENQQVWTLLAQMQCDLAQGYYLSRPLPVEDLVPWIAAHTSRWKAGLGSEFYTGKPIKSRDLVQLIRRQLADETTLPASPGAELAAEPHTN